MWDLLAKLIVYMGGYDKGQITMHSCVIDMDAWRDLTAFGCSIPSEVELCNRYVTQYIVLLFARKILELAPAETFYINSDDLLNFTFDRNEDFYKPFREFINEEKQKSEETGIKTMWQLVDGVGEGEMKNSPGIQAADILAWGINRDKTQAEGTDGKHIAHILHQVVSSTSKTYDRQRFLDEFGPPLPNSYL